MSLAETTSFSRHAGAAHSPDRLARSYAYQVVLLDEWRRYGIEVVFLNKAIGQSLEDDVLLQPVVTNRPPISTASLESDSFICSFMSVPSGALPYKHCSPHTAGLSFNVTRSELKTSRDLMFLR